MHNLQRKSFQHRFYNGKRAITMVVYRNVHSAHYESKLKNIFLFRSKRNIKYFSDVEREIRTYYLTNIVNAKRMIHIADELSGN